MNALLRSGPVQSISYQLTTDWHNYIATFVRTANTIRNLKKVVYYSSPRERPAAPPPRRAARRRPAASAPRRAALCAGQLLRTKVYKSGYIVGTPVQDYSGVYIEQWVILQR